MQEDELMSIMRIHQCLAAAFAIALPLTTGCVLRSSVEYLIPNNYVGWVSVKCGVAEAAALTKDGNRLRISVPDGGKVRTSSSCVPGIRVVEYWYVDATGQRLRKLLLDSDSGPRITRITAIGAPLGKQDLSGWMFWVGADQPDEKKYQELIDNEFNGASERIRNEQ